jgi:Mrp family chromosome partitioning ATPase/capsular polysaccharide biosynthesis protein
MSQSSERWAEGPSLVQSIWQRRWLVLAVAVAAGILGYVLSQGQPPTYEATTRLYVTNPATSGIFQQQATTNLERYLPQQTQRIRSVQILTAAAEELNDGTTPTDLAFDTSVEMDLALATLEITASDASADGAAARANAVAAAYQDNVRATQLRRVERAVEELERSAEDIESQIAALLASSDEAGEDLATDVGANQIAGQIGVLTQRLVEIDALSQQLQVDARLFGSGVEFAEPAEPPGAPVSPRPRRTAVASALLAGLIASALAYWLAGRGHRIESRDEPATVLDAPLLGVLPTYKPPDQVTLGQRTSLEPRTTEAYRFVYSSLDATLRELGATSVMITSAGAASGKTETSLQVAATAARRGQRVLLVDGDVRMRGLSTFLRATTTPGLLDLAGSRKAGPPDSLVLSYPLRDDRKLDVLTAGRGSSSDDHLDESWFGEAFRQLVESYDLVIVDSPPLLAVADTATIAGHVDTIVLVVRERSDVEDLDRVRQRLRMIRQQLAGYVYLTPKALEGSEFDYGLVRSGLWKSTTGAETSDGDRGAWIEQATGKEAVKSSGGRSATSGSTRTERREQRS